MLHENPGADLDLPSDGASTFRDFVPRDVKQLERQIRARDSEKQARIVCKQGEIKFGDPSIRQLLALVPSAYEKMAKMPYDF